MNRNIILFCIFCIILGLGCFSAQAGRIQPSDLEYLGAFQLPDGPEEYGWYWGGQALTFYPEGDPTGASDDHPGSIYGFGHNWNLYVSEISIPKPVISAGKNLNDLNTASTLQPFTDIRGGREIPGEENLRGGLQYLPKQGSQTSGKIHYCFGRHYNYDRVVTHGWFNLDLSAPNTQGMWYLGQNNEPHAVNKYIFEIPKSWADTYTPGKYLATGRFRDGGLSGQGPALFAYGPWNDGSPPPQGATVSAVKLLQYSLPTGYGEPEYTMSSYAPTDEWQSGAWLTSGSNAAVVFIGDKAVGNSWYGYQNGVVYDECLATDSCPWEMDRGWWSDEVQGQIIFFDPADLAGVAQGTKQSYEPQPYASFNLNPYLYRNYSSNEKERIGGSCYDRENGYLYILEQRAGADDKGLVHVLGLKNGGGTGGETPNPDNTGWWYDPSMPATGVSIEEQGANRRIYLAAYVYDAAGNPLWYSALLDKTGDSAWSGSIKQYSGWALSGMNPASGLSTAAQGTASLSFSGADTGMLSFTISGKQTIMSLQQYMPTLDSGAADGRDIHGWWIDNAYPGMGFFIQAAGSTLFGAWYHYGDAGSPRWWTLGGHNDVGGFTNKTTYTATFQQVNGSTFAQSNQGTAALTFKASGDASLTWSGNTFNLTRFDFTHANF